METKDFYSLLQTEDTVCYKKYFYVLRLLLAAIYIERNHQVPPVLFSELQIILPEMERERIQ